MTNTTQDGGIICIVACCAANPHNRRHHLFYDLGGRHKYYRFCRHDITATLDFSYDRGAPIAAASWFVSARDPQAARRICMGVCECYADWSTFRELQRQSGVEPWRKPLLLWKIKQARENPRWIEPPHEFIDAMVAECDPRQGDPRDALRRHLA